MPAATAKNDLKSYNAMQEFSSIQNVCIALNEMAHERGFFDQEKVKIQNLANEFVESFAMENGLESHTVQPLMWSFSIVEEKLFDDGVIELVFDPYDNPCFGFTYVGHSKITNSGAPLEVVVPESNAEIENFNENEVWLMKLDGQLVSWKNELKEVTYKESTELKNTLSTLETSLGALKSDSKRISKAIMLEFENQAKAFQESFDKVKSLIKRDS